jgi:hypothetical protein
MLGVAGRRAVGGVGPWQRELNELGYRRGAKPLATGQYREPGPGFEQLLGQLIC